MRTLIQEGRWALRSLGRTPGFTVAALLALALGIGANTAIFSLVNAVLIRELPFETPDRLVWIWAARPDRDKAFFSIPNFKDYREGCASFERIEAYSPWAANLTGSGEPGRLQGARLTAHAFDLLGPRAAVGRTLVPADAEAGADRVVVLAHGLWVRRFGADPGVVGRSLVLNGDAYRVAGVLPEAFFLPNTEPGTEIFSSLNLETDPRHASRGANFLRAFGRLEPGAAVDAARSEMAAVAARLREAYPEDNAAFLAPRVIQIHEEVAGEHRPALLALQGAVAALLLIACANIAGLQIARGLGRRREIAIRAALGASRSRIAAQFLVESVVVALGGAALGLMLSGWALEALVALSHATLPRASQASVDAGVLLFTAAVGLVAGLLSGVAPALAASRSQPGEDLKAGSAATTASVRAGRARGLLVAAEIAISLVLLIGAGLLVRTLTRLMEVRPGFDADQLTYARVSPPPSAYGTPERVEAFYDAVEGRLLGLPGVERVALTSVLPLTNVLVRADVTIAGRPPAAPSEIPSAQNRSVSAGYFDVMGIPIVAGRRLSAADRASSRAVAVVDETLVKRWLGGVDPIGLHLALDDGGGPRDVEIVGVCGPVHLASLEEAPAPAIYVPFAQTPKAALGPFTSRMHLLVKTAPGSRGIEEGVRRAVLSVDADVPISAAGTMDAIVEAAAAPRRFNRTLMTIFAGAGLLLAGTGIYALIAGNVASRTREFGIRRALGARGSDVALGVACSTLRLAVAGVAAGLLAALALARVMGGFLYEVRPTDPPTYLIATLLIAGVALLAAAWPALRAARIDPAVALRSE